jgi:hypothetical protein
VGVIYCGFMRRDPPEPDEDDGDPPSPGIGDDRTDAAGPKEPAVGVFPVADGVVGVAVRDALTRENAFMLRHAALALLARHPRLVIVEFAPPALVAHPDRALLDAVAVLTEIAREAGSVDIGLCLVVAPEQIASVTRALDGAGVRELFEIRPTIADALDPPS